VARLGNLSRNDYLRQNFGLVIDQATAVALSLTSYVTDSEPSVPVIRCLGQQPRDALNQLILGWEKNDRDWMEGSLGPSSTAALNILIKGRSWERFRSEFWQAKSRGAGSVGYRFTVPNKWSEPYMSLEFARPDGILQESPALETHFTTGTGMDCGNHIVTFARIKTTAPKVITTAFLVNQSDIGELFRLIGSCAAQ
jgi:hypothetical protein